MTVTDIWSSRIRAFRDGFSVPKIQLAFDWSDPITDIGMVSPIAGTNRRAAMLWSLFEPRRRSVTAAPTWAAWDPATGWRFNLRIWASKERRAEIPEWAARILTDDTDGLDDQEKRLLAERVADFLADNDFGEEVTFRFIGDPANETFHFDGERTDFNGIIRRAFFLTEERAREIAQGQAATDDWLMLEARYRDVVGTGRIKLLKPNGLSVVSYIDDTIRVTDIPAGRAVVLRNTFLRPIRRRSGHGRAVSWLRPAGRLPLCVGRPLATLSGSRTVPDRGERVSGRHVPHEERADASGLARELARMARSGCR
jgi:hypothetical protein